MSPELLRVAAGYGLAVEGWAGGGPRWRATCRRCAAWLELPARPPAPVWALRRMCAFAARHRHRRFVGEGRQA